MGTAAAALGVAGFSLSFPATVGALGGFGAWTVAGLRGVIAALLAGLCLALCRVRPPDRRHWPGLATVAAGCVLGFPLLTTLALQTASTAHSAVVTGALPLATAALAALRTRHRPHHPHHPHRPRLAHRQSRRFWAGAVTGGAAVTLFALHRGGGLPTAADLLLAAALLLCAAGYAEGGRLARHLPGWQVIGWAAVAALPAGLLVTAVAWPLEPARPDATALLGLAYVGAVSQFGGFVFWYRGMALIGVARASQIQLAQPLLTLVWAVLLLGERLPAAALPTAAVVLVCIAVTQRAGARGEPPEPPGARPGV
ncbi:Permease of the drug/metabolite transporter (DMT) superfamily [Streptomyces aidingensis]|uniref:Permease of the drug/metabolite transporter (DMT) superfamily n=1 Tax=Streptomyces aidingensis TaxID=910347 RepID=A0A1I1I0P8_9ACTN|nr:Permease of the drug/metabolite transporter (DMT) superfamily [Streptomyces aidingensis]